MNVVADLHVHTTVSDGSLEPAAVPRVAREAGLEAVAVTDHDRLPAGDAPVERRGGVVLINGIELRVETPGGQRIDLLGYGVEPTPGLEEECERLQRDRIERGAAIIERVESRLGIDLDLEPREGLGRPHIARAIEDHPEAPYDADGAFEHLIGDGGPCFVARDVPDVARGRELLGEACSIVGLAHPLRYDDPEGALEYAAELDAVERYYSYDRPTDPEPVERAIETHGLLATGGSDAHDDRLARAGLDAEAYAPVRERLPAPSDA